MSEFFCPDLEHGHHHRVHGKYALNLKDERFHHIPKLKVEHFCCDGCAPVVDLRNQMPPVYDQGQLGSCSANALCAAFSYDDPNINGNVSLHFLLLYDSVNL